MQDNGGKNEARVASGAPPTAEQLTASRVEGWHQDGQALITLEGLRDWLKQGGLVAYGPRAGQLGAPAGSLVEATLGKKLGDDAELEGAEAARTLLARLEAEGSAVPLNLLGASGGLGTDQPDFVASAAVFSYVFTLRGNKAWKQAPATAGAVKVSPLALAVYEMLVAKVTMSSYDLATQLGKEVTEGAVLRALTELWGQLRVLPVAQVDGTATLWELTTARFTKQMKAGANAGQPSALSALISLYLGQAVAATEDEIETFLSPLAARSRVRDVVHALMGARQLETVVVEGKTLLHVAGELPGFAAVAVAEPAEGSFEGSEAPGSRISKFAGKLGGKLGTGLRAKPAFGKKAGFGTKPAFGARPAFEAKGPGARTPADRERRPFSRDDGAGAAKPRFDKPWSEDRKHREGGGESLAGTAEEGGAASRPRREYAPRAASGDGAKRTFSKPGSFGRKREGFGGGAGAERGEGRPAREEFGAGLGRPPRREFGAGDGRAPRREAGERSDRPASGGFKRAGGAAGSYTPRPKPAFGSKPAFGAKPSFGQDRGSGGGEAPRKVFRKFDAPREKKPFGVKPSFGAKPFGAKSSGPRKFGDNPAGERQARSFDGPKTFDRARGEGRPERPRAGSGAKPGGFAGKSGAGGGKKPFAKAGGPFAKFAEGKKPFRKPGPGKRAPSGGSSGGGFGPVKRKRPEGNG